MRKHWAALPLALIGLFALYILFLGRMGMVGPDEPRYADIGRAMALTGDWITPKLWGEPWFEKPALLYWMTGLGFKLGLSPDLAPRLPVALLSIAFLGFFFWRIRNLWDEGTAWIATVILATTAGWLTYSHVAVTDLPLAVFFSIAVLLFCESERRPIPAVLAGASLGLAVLAKGLVPLVLFVPVLAIQWPRRREWLGPAPFAAFSVVALPWYLLCWQRNGYEFIRVFFLEHHFGRFASNALKHVQPWWFYVPVMIGLLFPWSAVLILGIRETSERRTKILLSVVLFGMVFFSVAVNKLPGYLLPLLPALSVLMARSVVLSKSARWVLAISAGLSGVIPLAAAIVPAALANGLRRAELPSMGLLLWMPVCLAIGLGIAMAARRYTFAGAAAIAAAGLFWLQYTAFPAIDQAATARPLWSSSQPTCAPPVARGILYGLYYYAGKKLPDCAPADSTRP